MYESALFAVQVVSINVFGDSPMNTRSLALAALIALSLAACSKKEEAPAPVAAPVVDAAKDAAQKTEEAAKQAAEATKDAAKDAATATKEAAKDAADATKDAAKDAVAAAKDAAAATKEAAPTPIRIRTRLICISPSERQG